MNVYNELHCLHPSAALKAFGLGWWIGVAWADQLVSDGLKKHVKIRRPSKKEMLKSIRDV